MRLPAILLPLALAAMAASLSAQTAPVSGGTPLKQAAVFYHQGQFDSTLARLASMQSQGPCKRRDSLSMYQYLGMASARLGREDQAVGYFSGLLELDSLFQFPKNEDPAITRAFSRAREQKTAGLKNAGMASDPFPIPGNAMNRGNPPGSAPSAPLQAQPSAAQSGKISIADSGGPGDKPVPRNRSIGLALGALPLGAGWLTHQRIGNGLALFLLQAGGIALSMYASQMQSLEASDTYRTRDNNERGTEQSWQWVQRVSLSTALGAYLFSLIASAGD